MRGIKRKLTKDYILTKVKQSDIYAYYLSKFDSSINNVLIEYLAESNKLIKSPIRIDKDASLGFRYNNKGKLKMRDFNGSFWGDCFDLVGYIIKENSNTKTGFAKILEHIYSSMTLYENDELPIEVKPININDTLRRKAIFEPVFRDWNKLDLEYWNNNGISINTLNSEYIYPISRLYINKDFNASITYQYDKDNPAYAYYQGVDDKGLQNWIIYFPYPKKRYAKFLQNCNVIQGGLTYKPNTDILIITKSTKDIASIKELVNIYFSKYSFSVIAPPSESNRIKDTIMQRLINNHKVVATLFDFDIVGIQHSNYLKHEYHTIPLFFTNGRFNTINYNAKDFSEYNNKGNKRNLINIITNLLTEYKDLLL